MLKLIDRCILVLSLEDVQYLEEWYPVLAQQFYAQRQIIQWTDPEKFKQNFIILVPDDDRPFDIDYWRGYIYESNCRLYSLLTGAGGIPFP